MKKIISILYMIIMGVLLFLIFKVNILPNNLLYLISVFVLLISIILNIVLWKKNSKIVCIILLILMLGYGFISYYLYDTLAFIESGSKLNVNETDYYVVVLKDSNINKLEDVKMLGYKESIDERALNDIEIELVKYQDDKGLYEELISKKIEAIVLNGGTMNIMEEEIDNFSDSTKIIKRIVLKDEVLINKNEVNTKEPFIMYISGIDTYGNIGRISRSDVNMMVVVNPEKNKLLLVSIPRDYYVQLHGTMGLKDKLTHSGIYGIDMTINTINDFFGTDIKYYVRVNFDSVINVVDTIGGISIYSDKALRAHTDKNCYYVEGINNLDGKCSLAFARERYAYIDGDHHRVKNQQTVLSAIINKISNDKNLLFKYNSLINSFKDNYQSNLSMDDITAITKKQINSGSNWDIEMVSVTGYNSFNYTYSYSGSKLYVMEPDYESVEIAKARINEVLNS